MSSVSGHTRTWHWTESNHVAVRDVTFLRSRPTLQQTRLHTLVSLAFLLPMTDRYFTTSARLPTKPTPSACSRLPLWATHRLAGCPSRTRDRSSSSHSIAMLERTSAARVTSSHTVWPQTLITIHCSTSKHSSNTDATLNVSQTVTVQNVKKIRWCKYGKVRICITANVFGAVALLRLRSKIQFPSYIQES